ncbi:AAA family ATPase [Ruminococcus sp. OA3]|uniref:ATP-binding protein n=1 Tax=Ruminococcus sp. OA3 TaxID=2914164 RepID=UPI001F070953|nr:ATP-binding protein [Ruminococcus sp. OA3]MCH1984435.1 AAA family ATPase [Ruminococcus sp. OA3]
MTIKELEIKNFGKFHDRKVRMEPGINLIYGPNESGKTTLHTFIKSMLYGMRRQRGRAAGKDVYSRYEPWENGTYYAGTLRFESGEKIFCIRRGFHKNSLQEELICESDGEKLSIPHGDLKMLLGNVSEAMFDNTVCIGQLKSRTDEGLPGELRNYMVNYQESSVPTLDVEEALYHLKLDRKEYEHQMREERQELQMKQKELRGRMGYVEKELTDAAIQLEMQKKQLHEVSRDKSKESKECVEKGLRGFWALGGLALILVLAGILFRAQAVIQVVAFCCALLAGALIVAKYNRQRHFQVKEKEKQLGDTYRQKEEADRLRWEIDRLKQECAERSTELENLKNELQELVQTMTGENPLQDDIDAIDLAMEAIEKLSAGKKNWLGEELQRKTAAILSAITHGKYASIHFSDDMQMGICTRDAYVSPEQLSRGTLEQIYFAFRMAVSEVVCREERLPLMLDEVFVMYDDERLGETLQWLAGCGLQVLLFTCHRREGRLLEKLKIPYHEISLAQKE